MIVLLLFQVSILLIVRLLKGLLAHPMECHWDQHRLRQLEALSRYTYTCLIRALIYFRYNITTGMSALRCPVFCLRLLINIRERDGCIYIYIYIYSDRQIGSDVYIEMGSD